MSGPNAPRIIVIPQSMLTQTQTSAKSILRISPQGKLMPAMSSVGQGGRILPSLSTVSSPMSRPLMTNTTSILSKPPVPTMMVKPVASVAGLKRPAPMSSLLMELEPNTIKKEKITDKEESHRKRANLDHLSPEERLMRRKLKNRVAAQTARDKKRVHMEDMEVIVRELREEKKRILEDNARLQATNNQLTMDNAALMAENQDLTSRLSLPVKTEQDTVDMAPFSPESMPRSPLPLHLLPLSPISQPPTSPTPPPSCSPRPSAQKPSESAEPTNNPRQKDQGLCAEEFKNVTTGPGLSSNDLTTWPAAILTAWWLTMVWTAVSQSSLTAFMTVLDSKRSLAPPPLTRSPSTTSTGCPSLTRPPRREPPPLLPIKKRCKWDQAMRESPQE